MSRQMVMDEQGGGTAVTPDAVVVLPRPRTESPSVLAPGSAESTGPAAGSLVAVLAAEDAAEEAGELWGFERLTCSVHRRWIHQCVHSPLHVIPVTGHRWCRNCQVAANVAIDELTWTVTVSCPHCRRVPSGPATRQLVSTCQASLAAAACAPTSTSGGARR